MPLVQTNTITCDGCEAVVDTNVQPRVILTDANQTVPLHFCTYECVGRWAASKHETFETQRLEHLAVTVEQLNATLARAYGLETGQITRTVTMIGGTPQEPVRGEYETVASVPLHPLVELFQEEGKAPQVRAKAVAK